MKKIDEKKHPKLVKVLRKVITIGNIILRVIAILLAIVFVVCVFDRCSSDESSSVDVVSASADYFDTTGADLSSYPNANYYDISKVSTFSTSGFSIDLVVAPLSPGIGSTSFDSAGLYYNSLVVARPSDSGTGGYITSYDLLKDVCPHLKVGSTYTLSASSYLLNNPDNLVPPQYIYLYGSNRTWNFNSSIVITEADLNSYIVYYGVNGNNVYISNIMINLGAEPLPYSPNYDSLYNSGYVQGDTDGYSDGYVDGTAQGESLAQYGYFSQLEFVGVIEYSDGTTFSFFNEPVKATLYTGGASAASLYNYVNSVVSSSGKTFANLQWGFSFGFDMSDSIPMPALSLGIVAPEKYFIQDGSPITSYRSQVYYSDVMFIAIPTRFTYDSSLNSYRISFSPSQSGSNFPGSTDDFENYATYLGTGNFNTQDLSDLLSFTFVGSGQNAGYLNGYNVGLIDGQKLGNNTVYTNGYNAGYSDGFQIGFNQADSGGFSWLVSSVQQFLNTNFFGDFGIGTLLYVGLGLTLVTLFLKYFAGG